MSSSPSFSAREQRWFVLLLLSFIGFLGVFAWMNRPTFCLESEVLRRLDWRGASESFEVYRCRARMAVPYRPRLAEQLPSLNRRLEILEQVGAYYLGSDWKPARFTIEVADEEHPHSPAEAHRIDLNPHQLFETHELERQILARSLFGEEGATSSLMEDPSQRLLIHFLWGLAGYRPEEMKGAPTDWKISLYGEAIDHSRQMLSLADQKKVFTEWRQRLKEPHGKALSIPAELTSGVRKSLTGMGYRPDKKMFQLPFAVLWADRELDFKASEWSEIQNLMAAVLEKDRIRLPYSSVAFSRLALEPVQVGRLVLFHCGLPRLDEMEKLGVQFEHLLIIQDCGRPELRKIIASLLSPRNFALDFPRLDFVQVHWPSLQLALQKTGQTETSLADLLSHDSLENFKRIGYLSLLDRDEATGAQSWKGALQPFPLFRLQGPLNLKEDL